MCYYILYNSSMFLLQKVVAMYAKLYYLEYEVIYCHMEVTTNMW
jgi:hypothetical protein